MPYIYADAKLLQNTAKVGSTQCVALVQIKARCPETWLWAEGTSVLDSPDIKPGTAIATFVNGVYQSLAHGNHAALFLRFVKDAAGAVLGFWVMDQWKGDDKLRISERFITVLKLKQNPDGSWPRASNCAEAYSIIERKAA